MTARNFLVLYWGGEGSTFLLDSLSNLPGIFVPGLEPLEHHQPAMRGVPVAQKLDWLRIFYAMPPGADRRAWQQGLAACIPLLGPELAVADENAAVCGLKVRPSVFITQSPDGSGRLSPGHILRWIRDRIPVPEAAARALVSSGAFSGLDGLADLLAAADVRVIALRRNNVVRQALAMYRMNRQGHSQFSSARGPTQIDPALLQRHITDYENAGRLGGALNDKLAAKGVSVLEAAYEDLDADSDAFMQSLLEFIGLGVDPPTPGADSRFRKSDQGGLDGIVSNVEELRIHFAGTRYEEYF